MPVKRPNWWPGAATGKPAKRESLPSATDPKAWPIWARILSRRRADGDRGVGDTVERVVGLIGSEPFAFWHYCVFGAARPHPKCPARWNKLYPYPALQPPLKGR